MDAKEKQAKQKELSENDWRFFISHEAGLRVLGSILYSYSKVHGFEKGGLETILHNNGRREVGHKILTKLRALDPDIETKIRGAIENGRRS